MKKTKLNRILAIFMSVAILILSVGCGDSSKVDGDTADATSQTEPIVIRFNQGGSENEVNANGLELFKEEVEKNSDGNMKVEIYYNSQLGESTQDIPNILKGNYEMASCGATYIAEYMPELGVLNMGYLYKNKDHADAVLNGEVGEELFDRIAEETGTRILGAYYFGARNVCLTIDREVKTPDDLKDIKMRTNGTEPMMFLASAMGANPVGIAYAEMYTALQTGTVDGQENPINTVVGQKLYEVSKSLTYTRHYIDFSWYQISDEFYQGLSEENRKIIDNAIDKACELNNSLAIEGEESAEEFLKEQGMIFYDADTTAIREQVIEKYKVKAVEENWDMDLFDKIQEIGEQYE